MAKEDTFVAVALQAAKDILGGNLNIEQSKSILYQITVDNKLNLTVILNLPREDNLRSKLINMSLKKLKTI